MFKNLEEASLLIAPEAGELLHSWFYVVLLLWLSGLSLTHTHTHKGAVMLLRH